MCACLQQSERRVKGKDNERIHINKQQLIHNKEIGENIRVVGTVTVIGIFPLFCAVIRISAKMASFLNDIWNHGRLVFHVVPELPARCTLFSVTAA
jgi:hypothetical protein